jgi:hypothetical protein
VRNSNEQFSVTVDLVVCSLFYLRLQSNHFSGTYPPNYNHSWSFYMQIVFWFLSIAYNEVHLYLFKFVLFWRKNIGARAAYKMLVKSTPDCYSNFSASKLSFFSSPMHAYKQTKYFVELGLRISKKYRQEKMLSLSTRKRLKMQEFFH